MEPARAALPELHSSTPSRQPPQNGGRGTSPTGELGLDGGDAPVEVGAVGEHLALRRRPRADLAVARAARRSRRRSRRRRPARSAPRTRTWRCRSSQANTPAPRGLASSWRLFGAVVVGEEHEPAVVDAADEHDTGRRAGRRASTVASDHRVRLGRPRPSWRRRTTRRHCSIGSAATSATSSPAVSYCTRRANSSAATSSDHGHRRQRRRCASAPRMYGRSTSGITRPSRRAGGSSRRSPPRPAARRAPSR